MHTSARKRARQLRFAIKRDNNLYQTNLQQTNRMFIAMALTFVIMVSYVYFVLMFRPDEQSASIQNGVIDLTTFNFDKVNAKLPTEWEYYPGKLLSPDDFTRNTTGEPRLFTSQDRSAYQTGTYRAVLLVAPNATYGMSARSLDFATKIFIDGKEVLSVGEGFTNAKDFSARIKYYLLPVMAQSTHVEIIIHYANFTYPEGGDMQEIVFGLFDNVNRSAQVNQYSVLMLSAALQLLALYYLMLFISGRGLPNGAFALCCFYLATRKEMVILSMMPQDFPWNPLYRFSYFNNIGIALALLLMMYALYPTLLPTRFSKITVRATIAVTLGLLVATVVLTPYQVAIMATPSYLVFIPTLIFLSWAVVKLMVQGRSVNRVMALGMAVIFISLLFEVALQRPFALETFFASPIPEVVKIGLSATTMLTFAICQMIALSFENAELIRLNRLKTEFLQNISHELKTPLAVISTDILNASDQLEYEMDKGDIQKSLKNAQEEIMRMSRMVNSAMQYPATPENSGESEPLDIAPVLRFSVDNYRPMTRKRNNTLSVDVPVSLPLVYANADMIIQVLSNLLSNANRHTHDGEIIVSAAECDGKVIVIVTDNGEGISAALLPHVFERGISAGRSGYGLSISKNIIEALGGEISLTSEQGKGTTTTFILPVY